MKIQPNFFIFRISKLYTIIPAIIPKLVHLSTVDIKTNGKFLFYKKCLQVCKCRHSASNFNLKCIQFDIPNMLYHHTFCSLPARSRMSTSAEFSCNFVQNHQSSWVSLGQCSSQQCARVPVCPSCIPHPIHRAKRAHHFWGCVCLCFLFSFLFFFSFLLACFLPSFLSILYYSNAVHIILQINPAYKGTKVISGVLVASYPPDGCTTCILRRILKANVQENCLHQVRQFSCTFSR